MLCDPCYERQRRPGPKPVNTTNLSSSCYSDASLQMLFHLDDIRQLVLAGNFPGKPLEESGRNEREWRSKAAQSHVHQSDAEISKSNADHMAASKRLASSMKYLFKLLDDSSTGNIDKIRMRSHFNLLRAYNPKWAPNVPDDAAELISDLLDCLILVTDTSDPSGRKATEKLDELAGTRPGNPISLQDDTIQRFSAYNSEGRTSQLFGLIVSQEVVECACTDRECGAIGRGISHHKALQLLVPRRTDGGEGAHVLLQDLLRDWAVDKVDMNCPFAGDAHPGKDTVRCHCLTMTPKILLMHIGKSTSASLRGHEPDLKVQSNMSVWLQSVNTASGVPDVNVASTTDRVDVPEFLDIAEFADNVELPSERASGIRRTTTNPTIYRLAAVTMFIDASRHYVPYVRRNGSWYKIDDVHGVEGVVARHPQAAMNDSNTIPYFLAYMRESKRTTLPVDSSGEKTTGFLLHKGNPDPGPAVAFYAEEATQVFKCTTCSRSFATSEALDAHAATHQAAQHICTTCSRSFATSEELATHVKDHQAPQHACDQCSDTFGTGAELEAPQARDHQAPQYACDKCSDTFGTGAELEAHKASDHRDPSRLTTLEVDFRRRLTEVEQRVKDADQRTKDADQRANELETKMLKQSQGQDELLRRVEASERRSKELETTLSAQRKASKEAEYESLKRREQLAAEEVESLRRRARDAADDAQAMQRRAREFAEETESLNRRAKIAEEEQQSLKRRMEMMEAEMEGCDL